MRKMKKILSVIFLVLCCFSVFAFGTEEVMLDPESPLYLQDIPFYEGIDEFQEKLNKIRTEENREPLGLVLCGGSARAFCHIGVLKSLEENNITPDFIVANSMGAIIGMLYAYGISPDKIVETVSELNLSSYFDPVVPVKGGVLSQRNYEALINEILGKPHTDLSECPIPIVVLTEDFYSKRQIWHAKGDFAKIMTGAFVLPAVMEPRRYNLCDEEKTPVLLGDSGGIDFSWLTVATQFSENLLVSTAFYDVKVNFNNFVVIINRLFSIVKERQAVRDLKKYKPIIIRNDVEKYSFMAFDKAEELSQIGYESTQNVMDIIKETPHSFTDLSERRKQTDIWADKAVHNARVNKKPALSEPYWGVKIWPVFQPTDFPEYFLYDKMGIAAYGFEDSAHTFARLGVTANIGQLSADGLFRFNPSSVFDTSLFASYRFAYQGFKPDEFYGATTIKVRPDFFFYELKGLLFTGEYLADYAMTPKDILFKGGIDLQSVDEKKYSFIFKPYYYISGSDFSQLSHGIGSTVEASLNSSIFSKKNVKFAIGAGDSFSIRYAVSSFGQNIPVQSKFYKSDFYRAAMPEDQNRLIFTNSAELYFASLDTGLTAAELIILQQMKIGGFFDLAYNNQLNYCAGGFLRGKVSFIGLSNFILEGGGGWNFKENKAFGYFEMKNRI